MMRGEVSLAESTLVPQKPFLGLLFCQKSECSAKWCRLAYLGWGKGFHLTRTSKAEDQTHSQPDTWRPQISEDQGASQEGEGHPHRGAEWTSEASRMPGPELRRSTSNPASAHPTTGELSYPREQPKDQHRPEVTLQTQPHAISEVSMEEGTSERVSICPKATQLSRENV